MPMAMRGQVLGSEQRENANVLSPFAASIWSMPASEPAQSSRPNRIDSPAIVGVGTALAEPFYPEILSLHRRSSDGSDSVSPKAKARGVERASTQPAMPLLEKGDDPVEECPIVGISRRMTYPESNRN